MKTRRCGFSLVELLVAIVIIGVLLSLTLVAVNSARESARTTACKNNIRQHSIAMTSLISAQQEFPGPEEWRALLRHHMEQQAGPSVNAELYCPSQLHPVSYVLAVDRQRGKPWDKVDWRFQDHPFVRDGKLATAPQDKSISSGDEILMSQVGPHKNGRFTVARRDASVIMKP